MADQRKSQLVIIFMTVFIYLVGFGIVIPLTPVLGREFGASSFQIGLLMSVYSAMQFLFSPFWGKLSDRYGRRPILLFCLLGEGLSYILYAHSRSLEMLFVARVFAGFFGASLSTASAYISDITPPHERSKGMALIGAAFGLGFIVGPGLGAALSLWGENISSEPFFASSFTAYWVAGICFANFLFAVKALKESLKPENVSKEKTKRISLLINYLSRPTVGMMIAVFFLTSMAMSTMEATLILFVGDLFQWGMKEVSLGFAYIGIISAFTQGFLVRRLLPVFGEKRILVFGVSGMMIGLTGIAFATSIPFLTVCITILALGFGCTNPSILGTVSLLTGKDEQGKAMGVTQSVASLGRILGPAYGGYIYSTLSITSPFISGGIFAFCGLAIVAALFKKLPESAKNKPAVQEESLVIPIGEFQIENLVRNRIPFCLVQIEVELEKLYKGSEAEHILRYGHSVSISNWKTDVEKIKAKMTSEKYPLDYPVVCISSDGSISKDVAADFDRSGYKNVYYVLDGIKGLI